MPKRKVPYSDDDQDTEEVYNKKHSLDSDEEDDDTEKPYVLTEEDIEGEEDDSNVNQENGGISLTPFNLMEEMQEGYFDGDGHYHPNEDKEKYKDAWLDSIDYDSLGWVAPQRPQPKVPENVDDDEVETETCEVYREILALMKPKETVTQALKRLGKNGGRRSASQKWLKKTDKVETKDEADDYKKFLRLTELSNTLVLTGDVSIYSDTYEKLQLMMTKMAGNDVVDIFADYN